MIRPDLLDDEIERAEVVQRRGIFKRAREKSA